MSRATVTPLTQDKRVQCSLPLRDADLGLPNANWTKGLQAMSDWIWSANLNPVPFPNNLARYFLQVPGIFEQQLNYSTTLIFDLPSFRNGIQVSGFVDRVTRELVISYIAQVRHCWYSMTHHAILGRLTANQAGMSEEDFAKKWSLLTEFRNNFCVYNDVQRAALTFAERFATNPKLYSDQEFAELKTAFAADFKRRHESESFWTRKLLAARCARGTALAEGLNGPELDSAVAAAVRAVPSTPTQKDVDAFVNAAVVELAFLCLQFVALTCVFTGLNLPDESFLPGVMMETLPDQVIAQLNELNGLAGEGLPVLVPPELSVNETAIEKGWLKVEPAALTGGKHCRVPLQGYEPGFGYVDRDRGVTVGGVQVGVYGWGFGWHFPGSLVYTLMHHPELARFEPPYSLPLLFNEDEWRNGTQTAGFVSRFLKEVVIQKVYKTNRSRYGIEHHTMFLYNAVKDEYGVGRFAAFSPGDPAQDTALKKALAHAEAIALFVHDPKLASAGTFGPVETAAMEWTKALMTQPHGAHYLEDELRQALEVQNRREISTGERRLDTAPGIGEKAACNRLLDHQIAELAMMIGHMDGLGRVLTILKLEAELPVQQAKGFFQDRPGLHDVLRALVSDRARTLNELFVNPEIAARSKSMTGPTAPIDAAVAARTGEF